MRRLCIAAAFLLGCRDQDPADHSCPMGLELCGSACVDLASSAQNCGACDKPCTGNYHCASGLCVFGQPTCQPPSHACINEHGFGSCCSQNQVCVGNPMTVYCVDSCSTSSDCTSGCCSTSKTCGPSTQCLCKVSSECPSGACAPQTNTAGDPVGPMICKPNDGALYNGCNGIACTSGCCVADSNGNHFCATACVDSTTCGSSNCVSYDFSVGTCAGPTACGP